MSDAFVWPPRPAGGASVSGKEGEAVVRASTAPIARNGSGWRGAMVTLERQLLRPTVEPIERQVTDLGWVRNAREAYCNRCGRTVGPHEEDEFGCANCRDHVSPVDRVVRLGEYSEPLDRWIWTLKFQRIRRFGASLGHELGLALREAGALSSPPVGGVLIQPMPTSRRRRMARGIDHSAVLAEACRAELGVPMVRYLRRAHRRSQRSVPASERWSNAQGSVLLPTCHQKHLVGGRVILIDDVRTTGATARAAAFALKGQKDARYSPAAWGAREVWHAIVANAD